MRYYFVRLSRITGIGDQLIAVKQTQEVTESYPVLDHSDLHSPVVPFYNNKDFAADQPK